ncbi:MAG: restriction endonuclease subunit S [Xanthomonadales bacterium]|nr:restriction endonuclease subunit S [Xanthomonadales bacterium]
MSKGQKLEPKLRFPEFRGAAVWEPATLGKKSSILKGKGISKADLDPNGSQACIRYGELYTRYGETIREAVSRTKVPTSELFLSKPDDVIIPSSGETKIDIAKASCVLAGGIALGGDLNVIRSKLNGTFLSYYLNGPKRLDIAKVAQGDTVVHLYPHQLEALHIAVPTPAEQQQIAECLSSVDELMAAQARKVDALKTHKKGLMQQLFPREGETQPRLRFPEFQNAGEWEEASLGDYFDPIRNGFVGTATPYYTTSDGVRYLQGRNIKQGRIEADNLIYITNEFHNRQRKSHLKEGDILMVQSGHVGECAVVSSEFAGCNCHALVILTPKRKLSSDFFAHYFYSPIGELAIFQITTGNTIKHILASELKTLPVLVPDFAEQQRIASCLSSLDALITAETQKLEALKTHKKGLMQQLFPSAEEVEA